MDVEIGTEAAQLPEKEYKNGILLAVYTYMTLHPDPIWFPYILRNFFIIVFFPCIFPWTNIIAAQMNIKKRENIG